MYKNGNFSKTSAMNIHRAVKTFIRGYQGGAGDEEAYQKLDLELSINALALPEELQLKIENFVTTYLTPMVYDMDSFLPITASLGYYENGVHHIDSEDEVKKMLIEFIEAKFEVEKLWDEFANKELRPYLV